MQGDFSVAIRREKHFRKDQRFAALRWRLRNNIYFALLAAVICRVDSPAAPFQFKRRYRFAHACDFLTGQSAWGHRVHPFARGFAAQ